MRATLSIVLALGLAASSAMAADSGPLSPGHPAGIKQAQRDDDNTALYLILGAGVIAGIAIAASSGGGGAPATAPGTATSSTTTG
jgi:hypothetical protein